MTATLRRLWKKDNFQTAISIGLIIAIVAGIFFGSKLILNTDYPILTVESGSMCIPYGQFCNGWSHPFDRTLHVGDVLIIQGVNPAELNANYPYSDIIVFHDPYDPSILIVHRIIGTKVVNDTIYFLTKGDGNGNVWPQTPKSDLDPWDSNNPPGVPQSDVVGRVVMRIPWIGNITLLMRSNSLALPLIIGLILIILFVEFVRPLMKNKKNLENGKIQSVETDVFIKKYI